jgi:hypothetical protein
MTEIEWGRYVQIGWGPYLCSFSFSDLLKKKKKKKNNTAKKRKN